MVIIVMEHAHCGTTMVAGILHLLGVWMGDPSNYHLEDERIIDALSDECLFARIVYKRNKRYPDWGFKYPGAWRYADTLKKYLPHAVYFSIYKDPVSVTMRRFGKLSTNRVESTIRQFSMSINGIKSSGLRINYLSYSDAHIDPYSFVLRIADIAKLSPTEEMIKAAVQFIQPNGSGNPLKEYPCLTSAS